jgi:hypothetical protein
VEQRFDISTRTEETPKEPSLEPLSLQILTSLMVTEFQQIGHREKENDQQGW